MLVVQNGVELTPPMTKSRLIHQILNFSAKTKLTTPEWSVTTARCEEADNQLPIAAMVAVGKSRSQGDSTKFSAAAATAA